MTGVRFLFFVAIAGVLACAESLHAKGGPTSYKLTDQQPTLGNTPGSNGITDVVIDGKTIWLGTGKGLSVSSNSGATWANYYNVAPFGTEDISAIAVATVAGKKIIWVATAHSETVTTDFQSSSVGVGSGLHYRYFSGTDTAWHDVPQPLDSNNAAAKSIQYGAFNYVALPVIVPEQNLTYDVAVTPSGNVFIASFAGGLRKSTDNGKTWQRILLPADGMDTLTPQYTTAYANLVLDPTQNFNDRAFSVIALSDSEIFCGTASGINKSTDGGVSWIHLYHKKFPGISGNFVVALAHQPNGPSGNVWAATVDADRTADPSEERAVSYSVDNGNSWSTANPLRGSFAHNFGFLGNVVYAATDTGLWCTDDGGASWTPRNKFRDAVRRQETTQLEVYAAGGRTTDSLLFIGTADGLVISKESGSCFGTYNVLQSSKTLASASQTYAYPSPFSPSQEITRIHYRVGDPGVSMTGSVTIEIYDFAMHPVRTVVRSAIRDNEREYDEIWDGLSDGHTRVANGVYHYSVRVDGGDRRWGKIIVLQ